MINLSKKIYNQIKEHSWQILPEECCGLLVRCDNNVFVIKCKNIADDKLNNFAISPHDYVKAATQGSIVAFYHSHTSPNHDKNLTILDKFNSTNHQLPIILYNTLEDKFIFFDDKEFNYKYIGEKFEYGKNDCFTLVKKYYQEEFNIILPDIERSGAVLKNNPSIIIDNIINYGFKELDEQGELSNGDVIITKGIKGPTHLAIYIGNNQILHHRLNQYSVVEAYSDIYKSHTYKKIRHKNLWK